MHNLIIFDNNSDSSIIQLFSKKKKIFLIKNNIYDLNKYKNLNNLYMIENNFVSFDIFNNLLKGKKNNEIIINTKYPCSAKIIDQLDFNELKYDINKNLVPTFYFIKKLLLNKKKIFITILLHEFKKKYFLLENQIYNQSYISFINSFSNEIQLIKNLYVNFIVTNNLELDYKKSIYPYKKCVYKDLSVLENLYFHIIKKRFRNKIFNI